MIHQDIDCDGILKEKLGPSFIWPGSRLSQLALECSCVVPRVTDRGSIPNALLHDPDSIYRTVSRSRIDGRRRMR